MRILLAMTFPPRVICVWGAVELLGVAGDAIFGSRNVILIEMVRYWGVSLDTIQWRLVWLYQLLRTSII